MIKISGNKRAGVDGSSGRRHVTAIKRGLGERQRGLSERFLSGRERRQSWKRKLPPRSRRDEDARAEPQRNH